MSLVAEMPDPNHIYTSPTSFGYSILKTAAVYGANASGKSKFFEAFAFFRCMIYPPRNPEGIPTFDYWKTHYDTFRLSTASSDSPSFFEATIIINGIQYRYGIQLNSEKILEEWLYRKRERETLIMSREYDENGVPNVKFGKKAINAKIYNNIMSAGMVANDIPLLTILAIFNDPMCRMIMNEFGRMGVISANELNLPVKAISDEKRKQEIIEFMRSFDVNIDDLSMHEISPDSIPEKMRSIIPKDNLKGKLYDGVSTTHRLYDQWYNKVGEEQFMMEVDESFGTNRLLRLSWPIIKALKEGRTLLIDEIDSGLHTFIVSSIIKLFYQTDNDAQLIINTHDTKLLSYIMEYEGDSGSKRYLFRKDQIYVVNKNRYGESNIYPITFSQKNIRTNLENLYVDGMFTGVPYISTDGILEKISEHESQE